MDALRSCCSEEQVVLLADYGCFLATCLLLWHSRLLFPLKLFTVFLHEFSHATAVWLTCNKVTGIEVNENLGGLTKWTATPARMKCAQRIVLPAGYLGSAMWGGIILVCCAEPLTTRAVAFLLLAAFIVALGYALCANSPGHRHELIWLSCGFIALLVGLLSVCFLTTWRWRDVLLSTVMLLVAAMNTLFATYDIWEDCVARTVPASDAYRFAQLSACATPVCIGVIWLFLSFLMALGMLWLAIWRSSGGLPLQSIEGISHFSWICILGGVGCLLAALLFRCCCSRTYQRRTRGLAKLAAGEALEAEEAEEEEALADAEGSSDDASRPSGSGSDESHASSALAELATGTHAVHEMVVFAWSCEECLGCLDCFSSP